MDPLRKYPAIEDLHRRARKRIPRFAFDYLEGGAGDESGIDRNREALLEIRLIADYLEERSPPDLGVEVFGRKVDLPFGIAPVGLSGLIWPRAAEYLASAAKDANAVYCLSTVASSGIERIGGLMQEGSWFQLYPIREVEKEDDLLKRAWDAGFQVLTPTIDIPAAARRLRDFRNGLTVPPEMTIGNIISIFTHPTWALATLAAGPPKFESLMPYFPKGVTYKSVGQMIETLAEGQIDWRRIERYRKIWPGALAVKGVLSAGDARRAREAGCDGLLVSNHGGRQLDGLVSPIDVLPAIRETVGPDMTLVVDSGLRSGTDIVRAYAKGADFTLLGRAFFYGVGALGRPGAAHAIEVLKAEVFAALHQLGCPNMAATPRYLAN